LFKKHFSIFSNGDLDLDPRGSKCNTNQGLNTKFDNNISFLNLVIFWKPFFYFLSNSDIDPRGSKYGTNQGIHINLLYTKFDYTISFLSLVIDRKPFYYFWLRWPWHWLQGVKMQYQPVYSYKLALHEVWLQYLIAISSY
jgi:hypothetical protein